MNMFLSFIVWMFLISTVGGIISGLIGGFFGMVKKGDD